MDIGLVHQLFKGAIFLAIYMKKKKTVHPTSGWVFCQFVDKKFVGSQAKYSLLAEYLDHVSNYISLYKIKMSKNQRLINYPICGIWG